MRIGIIEILTLPSTVWTTTIYHLFITKQLAGITPQTISVWCRQLGHETFYAVYYGIGAPHKMLPPDLDIVFISCYTSNSPIAYALAKIYRKTGTRTVIGGGHAKSFPVDCLRFFDLVVKECDKELIVDILAGHFEPGTFISSTKPFDEVPTIEERMPEIRASSFSQNKWSLAAHTVPMLASVGCPYKCHFCTDWDKPYRLLSTDRLAVDLRYITKNLPNIIMAFHDANFGIKFAPVFDALETVPPKLRPRYVMQCSLSILNHTNMQRLKETNCVHSEHGIESWTDDYSNKVRVGQKKGLEKIQQVVEQLQLLSKYVPNIQANFIFGLDTDMGDEPITLTKHFMAQAPFVWSHISLPIPYGGTPLYKQQLADGRILKAMPFPFYIVPYLLNTLKNYDPVTYYEKLIELTSFNWSNSLLKQRLKSAPNWKFQSFILLRTISNRMQENRNYRQILNMLRSNSQFRAFHEGQSAILPEFYHKEYERIVGPYAELLSQSERVPNLEQMNPVLSGNTNILKVLN